MNDTLEHYNNLRTLKKMKPERISQYLKLEQHKKEDSKNILVICRTVKETKEAIKFISKDHIGECEVHSASCIIKINGKHIKFIAVNNLEDLTGLRYKEYYFIDEFNI